MQWRSTAGELRIRKKILVTVSPETATFDLNTSGAGYKDVVLTVGSNASAITIGDVYIGANKLTLTTDYTVAAGKVTLLKETLDGLTEGDHVVKIKTDIYDVTATITVADTTEG